MNTFENSANKPQSDLIQAELEMLGDVRKFFQTDSCAEMIGSMNSLLEAVLFSGDLKNVTMEMRTDIVNHLRTITLLSKLNEKQSRIFL